jgi:phage protein D
VTLLTPAYKLTLGDRIVDTTDEPQASTVVSLTVALDLEAPADSCTLVMGQVGSFRPQRGDEAAIELGYADNGGLTQVLSGTLTAIEPSLTIRRLVVHSAAASLLRSFADATHENKSAGDIVRELAGAAGVTVAQAEAGIAFPAYVIDGRRSAWQHLRELADLCGFDLYLNPDGELVFQRFVNGRTVHVFDFARDLITLEQLQTPPRAETVEAWGESPTGAEGEEAWGWLTKDFSGTKGSAGSGDPTLLLERSVLRTASAAQSAADALHTELQRRALRGRLLVLGNPAVQLGDAIRLQQNPETELNGTFQVRSVTHRISKAGGFTTLVGFRGL